jgi:hypothetical protein
MRSAAAFRCTVLLALIVFGVFATYIVSASSTSSLERYEAALEALSRAENSYSGF